MIVTKFGGTSVADAAAIGRLIEIIKSRIPEQPLVVVSALAGVTDTLLEMAAQAETEDGESIEAGVTTLLSRHEEIARTLPGAAPAFDPIASDAEQLRHELLQLRDR